LYLRVLLVHAKVLLVLRYFAHHVQASAGEQVVLLRVMYVSGPAVEELRRYSAIGGERSWK
jgi:hypothetical protein